MSVGTLLPSVEVLENTIKAPLGDKKAPRFWNDAEQRMASVESALQELVPFGQVDRQSLPRVQTAEDFKVNRRRWAESVVERLLGGDVGQVEWGDGIARCSFFDRQVERGLLNNQVRKVKIVHEVHRPKLQRLPATIPIPRRGRKAIKTLEAAGLGRDIRIMTGDLAAEGRTVVQEWTERTAIGRTLDQAVETGKATARVVGQGAMIAGGALAAVAAAPVVMATAFAEDPAILLGRDIVIYMWR